MLPSLRQVPVHRTRDSAQSEVEVVVHNFLDNHGEQALRRMLRQLGEGVPMEVIGFPLGLSKQRISQIAQVLGVRETIYTVHEDVLALANEEDP